MVSLERVRHAELKWDPVNHEPETMKRQTHRAPGLAEGQVETGFSLEMR